MFFVNSRGVPAEVNVVTKQVESALSEISVCEDPFGVTKT